MARNQFTCANNGSYRNDHVLIQQLNNNNGRNIEQTRQMSVNQVTLPPVGQQLLHSQQQPSQQYVTSNQGMQQFMPALVGQQVTYQQQAPLFSLHIIK